MRVALSVALFALAATPAEAAMFVSGTALPNGGAPQFIASVDMPVTGNYHIVATFDRRVGGYLSLNKTFTFDWFDLGTGAWLFGDSEPHQTSIPFSPTLATGASYSIGRSFTLIADGPFGPAEEIAFWGNGHADLLAYLGGQPVNFTLQSIWMGPVPEPATWAMMIAGFGLTGATLRRRRLTPCPIST